ncbi:MAG: hypothetical protein WDZ59_17620 [Pirellulales bacterium]
MEFNRNHYFMIGIIVLLLGIQFRLVDSYVLNEKTTRFLAERSTGAASAQMTLVSISGPVSRKVVRPPEWMGWALVSIGSVLVLHSLALPRPS